MLLKVVGLGAAAYSIAAGAIFMMQERLVFPAWAVPEAGPLPQGAEQLEITHEDGISLHGVYVPARRPGGDGTLLLAFPGNATNAQMLAEYLSELVPDHPVAAFYYRGYRPSTGAAAARHLIEDAGFMHDLVAERYKPERIVVLGQSLGSGVAASLAARRDLAGLILVTPFDALREVARDSHWWLPVSLLFRHDMDSAAALADVQIPVAIIAAEKDSVIVPERTDALRRVIPNLVLDTTLPGAVHGDVHLHDRFAPALREALEAFRAPAAKGRI